MANHVEHGVAGFGPSVTFAKWLQVKKLGKFVFSHNNLCSGIFQHEHVVRLVQARFFKKFANKEAGEVFRFELGHNFYELNKYFMVLNKRIRDRDGICRPRCSNA